MSTVEYAVTIPEIAEAWLVPPRFPAPAFPIEPQRTRLTLPLQPLVAFPTDHHPEALGANREVAVYEWSADGPSVLLVHGWGGCAAQFVAWIGPLLAAGFRVIAYDAPGHGDSEGTLSSAPASGGTIKALAAHFGDFEMILAHSLGAIATALALAEGVTTKRAVFLAPCVSVLDSLVACGRRHGLTTPEEEQMLIHYFETTFSTDLSLRTALSRIAAPPPLTLFHDRADTDVPFAEAEEIAAHWPGARLVESRRVGHTRILIARNIVQEVLHLLA